MMYNLIDMKYTSILIPQEIPLLSRKNLFAD